MCPFEIQSFEHHKNQITVIKRAFFISKIHSWLRNANASVVFLKSHRINPKKPKALVVGLSIVWHKTCSYLRALVFHNDARSPDLPQKYPYAGADIDHVWANYLNLQTSEMLKKDFKTLINYSPDSYEHTFISSPLPSAHFGDIKLCYVHRLDGLIDWFDLSFSLSKYET